VKVFVWRRVEEATNSYHSAGGVVVFAEDEERARLLANAVQGCSIWPDEAPDDVRECVGGEPAVYVMPDAGCC
jgi:hypothetical protein